MRKGSTALTSGNIYSSLIKFAMPILATHIFQNLYNSVDSIIVGNYVGTTALAAVGSCNDIAMFLTGFFTGLSVGAGVLFARYFGAKDEKNLHASIHTAITFSAILGLAMALAGILLTPFFLKLVDCPEDVLPQASSYLRIYFIGVLFTAMYNVGAGVLRAVGDSLRPFIFLVIASVLNVGLDLLTVVVFDMGVNGVAIATIISQLISVILVFGTMIKTDDVYKLCVKDLHINKTLLKEVIRLGIPSAIQSSLLSLSNLILQRYLNGFGSYAMAGSTAAKKIDKFIGNVCQSIGQAIAPYVSQNIGARKYERVKKGIKAAFVISLGGVLVMTLLICIFDKTLLGFFTKDEKALYYGLKLLYAMVPFYIFQIFNQIFSNTIRGYGKSSAVLYLSSGGLIGCRQIFLFLGMKLNPCIEIVFYSYPVGWFFSGLFVTIYYIFMRKKLIKKAFDISI